MNDAGAGRPAVSGPRRAVVTGGSRGVGRAVVEALAADGLAVVAVGRDAGALEATAAGCKGEVEVAVCDVSDAEAVEALFDRLGAIDVLVNNAGVSSAAPLHRTSLEDWERQLAVNATGAFLCTRAVLAGMRERDRGRVVMVASTAGIAGSAYTAAYTASKHAMVGLMRVAAAEVAGTGVTVNAVCPGWVRSEMTDRSVARISATTGRSADEALQAIIDQTPLGRLIEPAEVAAAVAYVCSDAAASVNGQCLVMDGGGLQR